MRRFVRYGVVPVGIFFILLIVTVIFIPILTNVQKYVPELEKQISEATGRSFSLGPDLGVSFFPWLSISFSDMKIGNPPGFLSDEFIKVRTFEARIKVLPLLRKQIQVSRFVVGGLSVNLEKNGSGQVNWKFGREVENGRGSESTAMGSLGPLSQKLSFTLLAVTDGQVKWHDRTHNVQYQAEDIMLLLNDFSNDRTVSLDCKATINGKQLTVEGKVGPILANNSQDAFPVDIVLSMVRKLQGHISGKITPQGKAAKFDLALQLSPFSPREFFAACDLPFPLSTPDSETFRTASLEFRASGDADKIAFEKGIASFDDSKLNFSLLAENFKNPKVDIIIDLDRIDLDRYLLLSTPAVQPTGKDPGQEEQVVGECLSWKNFALAGVIQAGNLKMHGGTLTEVYLPFRGKDGIFTVAPATFNTSGGQAEGAFTLDSQATVPTVGATLKAQGLEAETLPHDFAGSDYKNQEALPSGGKAGGRNTLKHLVAQKLSSPVDDDVKNLVGKDLVDPAVVAQRFGLQPETLRRSEMKKKFPVGKGKIRIGILREETALRE